MQIQQFDVIDPRLKPYIHFYYLLTTGADKRASVYKAYPSNNIPVCFFSHCKVHISSGAAVVEKDERQDFTEIIVGNSRRALRVQLGHDIREFSIVFRPLGINCMLREEMGDILQHEFSITRFFDNFREIVKPILLTGKGLPVLEENLLTLLEETSELKKLREILLLLEEEDRLRLAAIATRLHITERTINRIFQQHLGISPMEYRRICKFRQALTKGLDPSYRKRITAVAIDSGYYDQSDLTNEIKKITSLPPKQFFSAVTPYAGKNITWKME